MDNNTLTKCLRSMVGEDEFEDKAFTRFAEDLEKVDIPSPQKNKMTKSEGITESDDDDNLEFDDTMFTAEEDSLDDEAPVAVIDTELTDDEIEDGKVDNTKYIGKYICICPVCLKPIFSEKSSGEIYCPECDMDVEIEAAAGKVVDANEPVEEEPPVEEPVEEVPAEPTEEPTDEGNAESGDAGLDDEVEESLKTEAEEKSVEYRGATITKVNDSDRPYMIEGFGETYASLDDAKAMVDEMIDKDGIDFSIKFDDEGNPITESVNVEVCPEGSVTVTADDTTVKVAPSEGSAEAVPAEPVAEIAPVEEPTVDPTPAPEGEPEVADKSDALAGDVAVDVDEIVSVDDFDNESFDKLVSENLSSILGDGAKFESIKVTRRENGLVIEGLANGNKVRFICNESKSKKNVFRLEGLKDVVGRVFAESTYDKESKSLKIESMTHKFLSKVEGKVKVVSNI